MSTASPGSFQDPDLLDEYCSRIAGRLKDRLDERRALCREASARLEPLQRLARLLRDRELAEELEERLERAAVQLRELEALPLPGRADSAPEPLVPSPAGPAAAASPEEPGLPSPAVEPVTPPPPPLDISGAAPEIRPAPEPAEALAAPPPESPAASLLVSAEGPLPGPSAAPAAAAGFGAWSPPVLGTPSTADPVTDWGARTLTREHAPPAFDGWDFTFLGTPASAPAPPAPPSAVPAPAAPVLCLRTRIEDETREISIEGESVLGRRDEDRNFLPDVDLWPDDTVSRRHAVITQRSGRFYLRDLDSTNGTKVNGRSIPAGIPVELHAGDTICLGEKALLEVVSAGGK